MSDVPDRIVLKRDRDLEGRRDELWVRRGLFAVVALIPLLALANLFGQRPETATARASAADLEVYAPTRVRSGVMFEGRFTVAARDELRNARIVLDPGWIEGMTLNTVEPAPVNEGSDDGRLVLELGHVPAGKSHVLFLQFQVDPTNVGRRPRTTWLYDGDRLVATVDRTITVFP